MSETSALSAEASMDEIVEVLCDIERLREIAQIDLHNPELHERLEAITERSMARLGQPIGLVTMVLDSAQFVLGASGLEGWIIASGGTPIEWSFCARAVASREPYVVTDALVDEIQRTNPLVNFDGIRSYAGVPLKSTSGAVLGAHCVIGDRAHEYSAGEVAELESAAREIVAIIDEYRRPRAA